MSTLCSWEELPCRQRLPFAEVRRGFSKQILYLRHAGTDSNPYCHANSEANCHSSAHRIAIRSTNGGANDSTYALANSPSNCRPDANTDNVSYLFAIFSTDFASHRTNTCTYVSPHKRTYVC